MSALVDATPAAGRVPSRGALLAAVAWLCADAAGATLLVPRGALEGSLAFVAYLGPIALAAFLCARRAQRAVGAQRSLWRLLSLYVALWFAGELTWALDDLVRGQRLPFPSLADLFYLAAYPAALAAAALGFGAQRRRLWPALLDGAVLALTGALTGFFLLFRPEHGGTLTPSEALALAYPTLDLALLVILVSLSSGRARVALLLVALAFLAAGCTDYGFAYLVSDGGYNHWAGVLDLGWQIEAALVGLAALNAPEHPDSERQRTPSTSDRLLPPVLLALLATVALTVREGGRAGWGGLALAGAAVALMLLRLHLSGRARAADESELRAALQMHEQLALTDPLTGLRNRRFLTDALRREHERAQRSGQPLGLLLLDLDAFKQINDRHGHPEGDRVLRELAKRLSDTVRTSDLLARIGGEEFAVLAPDTDSDGLHEVGERLRRAIDGQPFTLSSCTQLHLTASIGGAVLTEEPVGEEIPLQLADQALYQAKRAGGNRTELALETARRKQPRPPRSRVPPDAFSTAGERSGDAGNHPPACEDFQPQALQPTRPVLELHHATARRRRRRLHRSASRRASEDEPHAGA